MQMLLKPTLLLTMMVISACFVLGCPLEENGGDSGSDADTDTDTDTDSDSVTDPRTDAEVCGSAECGTVEDNAGTDRDCGICTSPDVCYDNQCCEDTRSEGDVCGTAECGPVTDDCGVDRDCGTCTSPETCTNNLCVEGILTEYRNLQLTFTAPNDAVAVNVDLYLGIDASGTLVESRVLTPSGDVAGVDASTLYDNLHGDDYYVKAEAVDAGDVVIYNGQGTTYVERDVTSILNIILNQSAMSVEGNSNPQINAVAVAGRTVLDTYLDPSASGELYVAAPDEGEMITFTAQTTDLDGDALTVLWAVKDTLSTAGADVGTIYGAPVGPSITWSHDVEGKYYVQIFVQDGEGGAAAFVFEVYVSRGYGELQVDMELNSFPSISTGATIIQGNEEDLSDTVILLSSLADDPDGDMMVMSVWTDSCGAFIAGDPTADDVTVIPTMVEICTLTRTVCDPLGCNESKITMDINCTTLADGFDIVALGSRPFNDCAIGCIPDPAGHECLVNGWDCGTGAGTCGIVGSCGPACTDPTPLCAMAPSGTGGNCVACSIVGDACADAGAVCGDVQSYTNCPGVTVPVNCGSCSGDDICETGACRSPLI